LDFLSFALAEQERKNDLMARITGPDRDDAVKALNLYRQLYGGGEKQQPVQMSYVGTKDPVSGLEERTPVAFDPNTGAWQKMPEGSDKQAAITPERIAETAKARGMTVQQVTDLLKQNGYSVPS
jgi:hypothetical protein